MDPRRESNALRASVLDAALLLGVGSNRTVTNWIFNNTIDEDEEEQPTVPSPGLTSASTATSDESLVSPPALYTPLLPLPDSSTKSHPPAPLADLPPWVRDPKPPPLKKLKKRRAGDDPPDPDPDHPSKHSLVDRGYDTDVAPSKSRFARSKTSSSKPAKPRHHHLDGFETDDPAAPSPKPKKTRSFFRLTSKSPSKADRAVPPLPVAPSPPVLPPPFIPELFPGSRNAVQPPPPPTSTPKARSPTPAPAPRHPQP